MSRIGCTMAAVLVGGLAYSSPGQANDRSLRALMIPASSCQVDGNTPFEEDPFKTPSSIGRFTPGSYEVLCPLPVNNVEMSGMRNDNDISKFRVAYRDTDGSGPAGEVAVFLERTFLSGGGTLTTLSGGGTLTTIPVCSWSSNTDGADETDHTSDVASCEHDVRRRNFYVFVVVLDRTSAEVNFFGIDFP
jgi:hypothetical protein